MYDIVTIGGGLAGSALARAMAEKGAKVLVIERETAFRDRVRGEQMASWGVAEARELGIYDLLMSTCGNAMVWWDMFMMNMQLDHRDLTATTASGMPNLGFFHPKMQETLIRAAEEAGADVRRGAKVTGVKPGSPAVVTVEYDDGKTETIEAGLVAACDGRSSPARQWGNFEVHHEPDRMQIAGLLFEGLKSPDDTVIHVVNPIKNAQSLIMPQGNGRGRSYIASWKATNPDRLTGDKDRQRFVEESIAVGVAASVYEGAEPQGPLATFDGADTWVAHPYKDGIALVGDAAAASDPNWGQGLSLTLRDVRELRDQLLATTDPEKAGHAYGEAHDRYYGALRRLEDTATDVMFAPGPEMMALRGKVLPQVQTLFPEMELLQSGPDHVDIPQDLRARVIGAP